MREDWRKESLLQFKASTFGGCLQEMDKDETRLRKSIPNQCVLMNCIQMNIGKMPCIGTTRPLYKTNHWRFKCCNV